MILQNKNKLQDSFIPTRRISYSLNILFRASQMCYPFNKYLQLLELIMSNQRKLRGR